MAAQDSRERIGDRAVRVPRSEETSPTDIPVAPRTISVRGITSPMSLIYGFLIIDAIGTGLLMLPIASEEPGVADFLTCLFTASTAVTVTGLGDRRHFGSLDVVRPGGDICHLIFIGGLGFMTGAAFLIILVGQELGFAEQTDSARGSWRRSIGWHRVLVRNIVVFAVALQLSDLSFCGCTGLSCETSGKDSGFGNRCG